jgi:hypothetical protein
VCHALLQNPNFFLLLSNIDIELAAQAHAAGCHCGGRLHRANYPRQPRGCPPEFLADFVLRFSFCCNRCRKRNTSVSVRFLGRRVYLGLAVVLMSARRTGASGTVVQLGEAMGVPARTIQRWRSWWAGQFPLTLLWQASCALFMPPVELRMLPMSLAERFTGPIEKSMELFLRFLSPLTVGYPLTLNGGC